MNATMSASCSMEPLSLRSESWGRWLGRFSTMRLIWEQAITAALSSPAMTFREREISVISFTRLTGPPRCWPCTSCR